MFCLLGFSHCTKQEFQLKRNWLEPKGKGRRVETSDSKAGLLDCLRHHPIKSLSMGALEPLKIVSDYAKDISTLEK